MIPAKIETIGSNNEHAEPWCWFRRKVLNNQAVIVAVLLALIALTLAAMVFIAQIKTQESFGRSITMGVVGLIAVSGAATWWLIHLLRRRDSMVQAELEQRVRERTDAINQLSKTLRESEERYNLAMRGSGAGIWDWDLRTNKVYYSSRARGILGFSDEEYGDTIEAWKSRLHPDDRERALTTLRKYLSGAEDTPQGLEHRSLHKDGTYRWVLTRGATLRDVDGKPYRMAGSSIDITELKKAQESAAKSAERLDLATRAARMGIWDWNIPDDSLTWDDRTLELHGLKRGEFEGVYDSWLQCIHPNDRAQIDLAVIRALQDATIHYEVEFRVLWPNGNIRFIKAYGEIVRDSSGRALRMIGVNYDVTDQKKAEAEIHETRAFLESILENIPDMIFVKDAKDLRFVRFNKAGEDLLGYDRKELISKNDYDFFPKEEADWFAENDRQVLASGALNEIPEEPIQTRNSGIRYLHTKKIPIFDENKKPRYLLGISHDITERKRIEEEIRDINLSLKKKTSELIAANEELEAFAYSVSHDLRAPLRHISGFIGLLKEHTGNTLDAKSLRYVRTISQAAENMSRLIDDLLNFSRMGRAELRKTSVGLQTLIKEIIRDFQSTLKKVDSEWIVADLPKVYGDRGLLRQVFFNLIDNAVKYTRTREKRVIEIGYQEGDQGQVTIYVRDNGVGFDQNYTHKLFGVFQRLHGIDEYEGSGIGLASVQRIVHRHGGRVWAESQLDHGATFYVSLPSNTNKT